MKFISCFQGSHLQCRGLALQIDTLAGGKTADYVQHITTSIHDVVETYSLFNKYGVAVLQNKLVSKLKNTVSDRVYVNHYVRIKLEEDLNIKLLELKCNIHPLDGIVNAARNALKKTGIKGNLFGQSDCSAENLIYGLSNRVKGILKDSSSS